MEGELPKFVQQRGNPRTLGKPVRYRPLGIVSGPRHRRQGCLVWLHEPSASLCQEAPDLPWKSCAFHTGENREPLAEGHVALW
jgi:hypothetical protein